MSPPLASPPLSSQPPSDLLAQLLRQREAFRREGPPTLAQRRADLARLKRLIIAHQGDIEAAVALDFGHRAPSETAIMELLTVVNGINYLRRNLRRFLLPQPRHISIHFQPARGYVQYQPLGVIGIISPWNYPMALALAPLATALAAGNRAMIKPSELTPAASALLAKLLGEAFSAEQVAVVQGGAETGAAFAALPFDHLLLTRSTPVGRSIMEAAAGNLVPVTLELGGKSPAIIERGHAVAAAASIAYGKLANAGQTCIAPDYVLLHREDQERFVAAFDAAVRQLYPAGPASPDYTAIISERHHQRLLGLIEDARAKGARIVTAGNSPQDADARARTVAPTLVLGVTDEMQIMQEEIFGPLLPVRTCAGVGEAIDYIQGHPHPLALYYFGPVGRNCQRLLSQTISGNVTINNTLMHYAQDDLPFGGVGASGIGAYHGIEGLRALSHARGVLVQSRWSPGNLLRPPYGRFARFILKALLR